MYKIRRKRPLGAPRIALQENEKTKLHAHQNLVGKAYIRREQRPERKWRVPTKRTSRTQNGAGEHAARNIQKSDQWFFTVLLQTTSTVMKRKHTLLVV